MSDAARNLGEAGHAFRERRISANEFVRQTAPRWRAIAARMFSAYRRRLPAWVEQEDVEQELVMQALRHVDEWRPGGATMQSHLQWCSVHRTRRKMDHWRGASTTGNSRNNPGHVERAFSRIDGTRADERDDFVTRTPAPETDPLDRLESEGEFEIALSRCGNVREAFVLVALRAAEADFATAADLLWRNRRTRVECDIRDRDHALLVVRRTCAELERRVEFVSPPSDLFEDAATG